MKIKLFLIIAIMVSSISCSKSKPINFDTMVSLSLESLEHFEIISPVIIHGQIENYAEFEGMDVQYQYPEIKILSVIKGKYKQQTK